MSPEELIQKKAQRKKHNQNFKASHAEAIRTRKLEKIKYNGWRTVRTELSDYVDSVKSVPCIRCAQVFPPECMDFDHVRGEKIASISDITKLMRLKNATEIKRLLEIEIAKCDVICSNCHRIVTRERERDKWKRKWEEHFGKSSD